MSTASGSVVPFLAQEIRRRYVPNLPFKQEKLHDLKDSLVATDADLVKALGHIAKSEWAFNKDGNSQLTPGANALVAGFSFEAMLEAGATAQTFTSEQREIFKGFKALLESRNGPTHLWSLGVESKLNYAPTLVSSLMDVAEGRLAGDLKRYIGKMAKAAEKTAPEPKGLMYDILSICTLSLLGPWGTALMLAGGSSERVPTKEAADIALRMKEAANALKRQ